MYKILLCLSFMSMQVYLLAQNQHVTLDVNNTRIGVLNGGDFFTDLNNSEYGVPKAEGIEVQKKTIYSGSIWIGGYDDSNHLHLAAMTYRQRGNDFYPGPSRNNPEHTRAKYNKIYVIKASDIEAHIASPSSAVGNILHWPGNGDTTNGEPWQLAPFVDVDLDGVYEPLQGDYPKIKGAIAAYCIYNDNGEHYETGGTPFNFDIHQLFFQEDLQGNLLDDTNLASFKIVNRSNQHYHDVRFGLFIDFDLGFFSDDFVATDTIQNMIYAFNGDEFDDGILGYGENPPAQSCMFLNAEIESSIAYNNNTNPINGNPTESVHFMNYLKGTYMNGSPQCLYLGIDTVCSGFANPGDPVKGTGVFGSPNSGVPSDRRILGSVKPFDLAPGASKCIDVAFVYGRSAFNGRLGSVSVMKYNASQIQAAYNQDYLGWSSYGCNAGSGVLKTQAIKPLIQLSIYPNPSKGIFNVDGTHERECLLLNALGQDLGKLSIVDSTIDVRSFTDGLYFVYINGSWHKLIKSGN